MNIELGSVGSAIGNVASGVGRGAAVMGQISDFGPKLEGPLTPSINEGQVGLMDLTNTVALQIGQVNPISELRFDNPVPLNEVDVIAEANHWLGITEPEMIPEMVKPAEVIMPQVEPVAMSMVVPNIDIVEFPKPQIMISPFLEPVTKTENRISVRPAVAPATAVLPEPAQEEEMEEAIEEKVKKQEPEERLEEEETIEEQMYLEDENVSAQRRIEIREAIVKARVEADKLGLKKIAGWLVAKFLPAEHSGNRSQVIKNNGPDGSYQETVEAISEEGELESEEKAVEKFNEIVAEKKPVKYGKNGNPVGDIDVARVYKYKSIVKPSNEAYETVYKRVLKKKDQIIPVPTQTQVSLINESKPETRLEDYPALAEVFQKVA